MSDPGAFGPQLVRRTRRNCLLNLLRGRYMTILCDNCREPMILKLIPFRSLLGDKSELYASVCDDCQRAFRPGSGYITIAEPRNQSVGYRGKLCPQSSSHHFMVIRAFEGNEPVWKCIDPNCPSHAEDSESLTTPKDLTHPS